MYRPLKTAIAKSAVCVALCAGLFMAAGINVAAAQSGAFVQQMQVRVLHGTENLLTSLARNGSPAGHSFAPTAPVVPSVNPAMGNFAASFPSRVRNHILQLQS